MATKQKKETKSVKFEYPKTPEKDKASYALAEEGHTLAGLLRQKILANLPHDLQQAFFVHDRLNCIHDQLAPDDFHRVPLTPPTHDNLIENMHEATYLLTGLKGWEGVGLPDGYHRESEKTTMTGSLDLDLPEE